jgi:sugar phosphate isomerase/epimerase
MKLGINTYTYMWSIGFPGAQPEKPLTATGMLEKACELGVQVVQMGPNLPLEKLSEAELARFDRKRRDWELEIELGTRGLEKDHLERQAALCKRLGATLLRTIPEIGGQTPPVREIYGHLRAIRPLLEREGIRLALENGKIPAEELRGVLEEVGSSQVGVVLDMVNSLAVPEGWKEVTRVLAPYVMCLHFKDFVVKRVWSMMGFVCEGRPAGQGQIDTPWLLETLKQSRYDFNVILELWPPEQKTLEETIALEQAWARESIPFLRRFVPE